MDEVTLRLIPKDVHEVIRRHNNLVRFIRNSTMQCTFIDSLNTLHSLASLGAEIADLACKVGIDAKLNEHNGMVLVYDGSDNEW